MNVEHTSRTDANRAIQVSKALDRLVDQLSAKLDGISGKVKAPSGSEFKAGGSYEVWGTIARQAGNAADSEKTRAAIENVLIDYPEHAAKVWERLEPGPDVIPIDGTTSADPDSAVSRVSELSNADRFLERHGNDVRFVVDTSEFLIWDGKRWIRDSKDRTRIRALMAKASRWIDQEVVREPNEHVREMLREWAEKSERKSVINASADLLTTRKRIWVNAADLDTKHDLLNCQNGTVDLRTGSIRPHDRDDLLTCITPGDYVNGATHPLWTDTITKFIPEEDVRDYLQRFIGYAATGFSSEKAFPICWGGGNNGKGSIFETIAKRGLGSDYAFSISPDAVVNNGRQGQHAQERANIKFYGKRMALFEETADGDTLDAGAVKRMASGGDIMEARKLFLESFNFNPTHSVLLMTNAEPRVNCFDMAMKTRIKFIHFGVQVEPNGAIRHKLETSPDVQRAVLAWIVEGAVKYFSERLMNEPQAVKEATESYFKDQDTFGQFLSECFEVAEPGNDHYSATKKQIFEQYQSWAEEQGLRYRLSKISLGRELEKRGYRNIGNARQGEYEGLSLRPAF
jgi:putative DNA primase/helicase